MKVLNIVLHTVLRGILNFLFVNAGNEIVLAYNTSLAFFIGSNIDLSSNHGSLRLPPYQTGGTVWITNLESKSYPFV